MKLKITNIKLLNILLYIGVFFGSIVAMNAQTGGVRGIVIDEVTKEPLFGVTIYIKGTSLNSFTGTDGSFIINSVGLGEQILELSYLGYQTKEISLIITSETINLEKLVISPLAIDLDEIVLTGLRKSQLNSINAKRNSNNTREVLSTNDLGRLPDVNVAEATQRISGVTIETDAGEGRFISIRGIQPSLVNVSLNNGNLASTASGRETPLNLLPIEMIGSIEVMKTTTPDMEGTAIGGSVNINTVSAFDRAKPKFLIASVDALLTDQQIDYGDDGLQSRFAVTGGKRFGENEKFGVVLSGNYFKRDFSQSILDPDRWQLLQGTDANGNLTEGFLGPNEIEIQIEDNERIRYGFNADFEYRPSNNSKYFLRTLYTHNDETEYNSEFELTVAGVGEITNQTPTSGFFDAGSGELDLSSADTKQDLYNFSLGSENRFDHFLLSLNASYSKAKQDLFSIDGTFENDRDTESLLAATYDISNYFFDITAVDLDQARDPALYNLRNLNIRRDNTVDEDMFEASLDLKYDLDFNDNIAGYLKMGGRFRSRDKTVDRSRDAYNDDSENGVKAPNRYTLEQFAITPVPLAPQGGAQPNVHGDAFAFRDFFSNPNNLNNTDKIFFRADDTAKEIFDEDINYREDVLAGYVMGAFDTKIMNIIAGVRVEHTKAISSPFVDSGDGYKPVDFENNYTNFLPSINIKTKLSDNFIIRGAWTNTIGRANYDQLAGTSELDISDNNVDGTVTGSFEGANPNLKPYESTNYDLSFEYYFKSGGLASIGGFYKNIKNQIFENEFTQNNIEFQGVFFDELSFSQFVNLEKAKLWGFEASFDQAFTFLPGFWSGFGITANMAAMDSDVSYPGREDDDLPLLRQANFTYNIIPYFQKYGFEVRAAINFRSEFLVDPRSLDDGFVEDAIAANPNFKISDFDRYEDERTTVDLTAAYTFPSGIFKILAQARNLNNTPEVEYQGIKSRYDRYQTFGASYFLGVSFNF